MTKVQIRRATPPLCMGVLLAVMGFSLSLATPSSVKPRLSPGDCTLPPMAVVSGADATPPVGGVVIIPAENPIGTPFDLGHVVVNRPFTRQINLEDGYPPYEFVRILPPSPSGQLTLSSSGLLSGVLRATPSGTLPPLPEGTSQLPQVVSFNVEIRDSNPDPTGAGLDVLTVTFCITVDPVLEDITNPPPTLFVEEATDVTGGLGIINPPPIRDAPAPFEPDSDEPVPVTNDLPTGVQRQSYNYQFHVNGGAVFGGEVTDGGFTTNRDPFNDFFIFDSGISADTSSIFAGTSDGTYTLTVIDDPTVGTAGFFDLEITSTTDPELVGSTSQVIPDVWDGTGLATGLPLPPFPGVLDIGSVGVRVNINLSPTFDFVLPGDTWTIDVTAFTEPLVTFELDPSSPPLPEGMRLDENGLFSGTPSRAGDYTFILFVQQYDPVDDPDKEFPIHEVQQQFFIRIELAPVSSQIVATSGEFHVRFGQAKPVDNMRLHLLFAKDVLHDFGELEGAEFDIIIGDPANPLTLSEEISGTLTFGPFGGFKWPPPLVLGDPANKYIDDAVVLIAPLDPNLGLMKIFLGKLDLIGPLGIATAGLGTTIEVPITIKITGGPSSLNLQLDEILTFNYRVSGSEAIGTIPNGHQAATVDIGQFMVSKAGGSIVFHPPSGSDTLNLTMKGFLRPATRAPLDLLTPPGPIEVNILLGGQCGFDGFVGIAPGTLIPVGTFVYPPNGLTYPAKYVMKNSDPTIPVKSFTIDNRRGTFTLTTRAPQTNAAAIKGSANPGGFIPYIIPVPATPSLVITAGTPFDFTLTIRIVDDGGFDVFEGQYKVVLFRHGSKLSLR